MIVSEQNGGNMVMPVSPLGAAGNYGNGFGWGADGGIWMWLVFLIALMGGGFGNWNNGFGGGYGGAIPYMMSNNYTNNDIQRGFDQSALMNGITSVNSAVTSGFAGINNNLCNGFANVQQSLCGGFAGVNQAMANGFAQAEIANNTRQMSQMQQAFNSQVAVTGGLNNLSQQLSQCCCDNRLGTESLRATILQENCQDRYEAANNTRDIITNNTANTQAILDKLCQLEIDGIKQNYENRIAAMQSENNQLLADNQSLRAAARETAQTSAILANNQAQTTALEQYLNPAPIPAYIVQNPNCCGQYNTCCNG